MTKAVEVITSVQRRRRWSRAEKERIVAAALEPGAVSSEVARAAGFTRANCFVGGRNCACRHHHLRSPRWLYCPSREWPHRCRRPPA